MSHSGVPVSAPAGAWQPDPQRRGPAIWQVLVQTFVHVFVTPIHQGRPQPRQWPLGLRVVVVLTLIVTVLAGLVAVLAGTLRARSELAGSEFMVMPTWTATVLLWVLILIAALVLSATMHAHPAVWVITWLIVTPALTVASSYTTPLSRVLVPVVAITLLLMPLLVRRWGWSIWQFLVTWLLITVLVQVPLWLSPVRSLRLDQRPLHSLSIVVPMSALAAPAIAAAGYAATEVAVTTAQWFAHSVRNLGRTTTISGWLLGAVVATGLGQGWLLGSRLMDPPITWYAGVWIGSGLVVLIAAGLAWASWVSARSLRQDARNVWPVGMPMTLAEAWTPLVLVLAVALAAPLFPAIVLAWLKALLAVNRAPETAVAFVTRLHAVANADELRWGVRVLAALVVCAFGWWRAQRGRADLALLGSCLLPIWAMPVINRLAGGDWGITWNATVLTSIASVAAWVWLIIAALRRRLHNGILLAIWVVWLAATVYEVRGILDDPTTLIGSISAGGLVLAGLTWRLLTDGHFVRTGSKAFPLPTRVLLLFTNTLLGATIVAVMALGGGHTSVILIQQWDGFGEQQLGTPLLLAVLLAPFLVTAFTFTRHRPDPAG